MPALSRASYSRSRRAQASLQPLTLTHNTVQLCCVDITLHHFSWDKKETTRKEGKGAMHFIGEQSLNLAEKMSDS